MSGGANQPTGGEYALLALVWPLLPEDMTEKQRAAFAEAAALQESYTEERKSSRGSTVSSEAVGDVRVTYRQGGEAGGLAVNGQSVAPGAAAILAQAGLLTRWV